jgi:hypothetical protein
MLLSGLLGALFDDVTSASRSRQNLGRRGVEALARK